LKFSLCFYNGVETACVDARAAADALFNNNVMRGFGGAEDGVGGTFFGAQGAAAAFIRID
jgi:hypothetical protein